MKNLCGQALQRCEAKHSSNRLGRATRRTYPFWWRDALQREFQGYV